MNNHTDTVLLTRFGDGTRYPYRGKTCLRKLRKAEWTVGSGVKICPGITGRPTTVGSRRRYTAVVGRGSTRIASEEPRPGTRYVRGKPLLHPRTRIRHGAHASHRAVVASSRREPDGAKSADLVRPIRNRLAICRCRRTRDASRSVRDPRRRRRREVFATPSALPHTPARVATRTSRDRATGRGGGGRSRAGHVIALSL